MPAEEALATRGRSADCGPASSGSSPQPRPNAPAASMAGRVLPSRTPGTAVSVARGWKRVAFLTLAGLFFGLGVLGAVLPGLPATPFLLLASFFLLRSSPRLNAALLNSRLFGPILRDWQLRGGIRWNVKLKAVLAVTVAVGLSIWLSAASIPAICGVLGLAVIGIAVICRLPTVR